MIQACPACYAQSPSACSHMGDGGQRSATDRRARCKRPGHRDAGNEDVPHLEAPTLSPDSLTPLITGRKTETLVPLPAVLSTR